MKAEAFQAEGVRGFLHHPGGTARDAIVLAHGAGSNCQAPLLIAVAGELARLGVIALRCDLPYRQARRFGPPAPADAAADRDGLRRAVAALRALASARVFVGGHSYGGRMASMLAASEPDIAAALLLLSYPLHPPRRPDTLRTAHFPELRIPAFFAHGTRDPFGSPDQMRAALEWIPAPNRLFLLEGVGHDLGAGRDVSFCAGFLSFAS